MTFYCWQCARKILTSEAGACGVVELPCKRCGAKNRITLDKPDRSNLSLTQTTT